MTEEIIIDGVNVAGCEFAVKLINDNRITCHCAKGLLQIAKMHEQPESIKSGLCENNPNCYYKQFKRLEQENKELKEVNQSLSMLGMDLVSTNETVRKEFFRADKNKDMWREKAEEYRSALEEIQQIAIDSYSTGTHTSCENGLKEIQDKINEVLE